MRGEKMRDTEKYKELSVPLLNLCEPLCNLKYYLISSRFPISIIASWFSWESLLPNRSFADLSVSVKYSNWNQ
jgi:hypothetical protein